MTKRVIVELPIYTQEDEIIKGYREELDGIVYDTLWLTFNKKDGKVQIEWERFETDHHRSYYLDEKDLNGMVGLIKNFKKELAKLGK